MVIKKSQDARTQLHVWSKLLEGRIALQKVLVATRELDADDTDRQSADDATVKLRSQFCIPDEENTELDVEKYSQIDDEFLNERHEQYNELRDGTIEKWCEKTKIGTIPKKGYVALELPTLQLIKNSLKDKERLIKRTQLDRSTHLDDAYHPETFNDDDFYHHLLKDMISKEESRHWVEIQRLKGKIKRKADTKATKGRKIKKELMPKLINFMAPSQRYDSTTMPDRIRDELMKSLFGRTNTE